MLPGHVIERRDKPATGDLVGDTGTWFIVGSFERGSVVAYNEAYSMAEFEVKAGRRTGYTTMYDSVETFFREGGRKVVFGRTLGTDAVTASGVLWDASGTTNPADVALTVTAKSPGVWGNELNVAVIAGDVSGEFKIYVTHDTDTNVVETSPSLVDQAAAIAWAASSSNYIVLTAGTSASEDPRVQTAVSLASGAEGTAVADADYVLALARLPKSLGPGQVSAPGSTTSTRHGELLDHAYNNNRVALLDLASSGTAATLVTAAATTRALSNNRYGAIFAPWATVPGIAGGTVRTVPYSAVQAGIIAREEAAGRSVGKAFAGKFGRAQYAIGLAQSAWTDSDREILHNAGVNVARVLNSVVTTFGFRSIVNITSDPNWIQFNWCRLAMKLVAQGDLVLDEFDFDTIDGRGYLRSELASRLSAMLLPYWRVDGVLFGDTASEAFGVDAGESLNPVVDLQAGLLTAAIEVRMSPHAERTRLLITKTPITEVIS